MTFANRPLRDGVYCEQDIQPEPQITVIEIEHFNARGKRRVYGRGEYFDRQPAFHLDMWKSQDGLLFARFWSRGGEVSWRSYEIAGHGEVDFPVQDERWVPQVLRELYGRWVTANF